MSPQEAKQLATAHLRSEGLSFVASSASRDRTHNVWVVTYQDPARPDGLIVGGALVVTQEGSVHGIGSLPGSLDALMTDLESAARVTSRRSPWPEVLAEELAKPYFSELMAFVDRERDVHDDQVYPPASEMFAAFDLTPFEQVKVVLLGQDPYPAPGRANGLCFSVPRNEPLTESLQSISTMMEFDELEPLQHGDLTAWAKQGVLLLNTALTVPDGGEGGHVKRWKPFSDAVIRRLSARPVPMVFVLWGYEARKKLPLIDTDLHCVVSAPHPTSRYPHRRQFHQSRTFSKVDQHLRGQGHDAIEWVADD